jgi:GDP-4-dehydro-6-deoxy-D-mannose reductase
MADRILVTGSGGFAGSHLLAELGGEGIPLEADVTDAQALADAIGSVSPRGVVHLAAYSSVADSWGTAGEVWRVNVLGTLNVLEATSVAAPQARVLVASTGEVYGQAERTPTPETEPVSPVSPYAASKAAAELACAQAAHDGLDVVVARAFQHEGPGRDERFAVGSWTAQLARLEESGGGTLLVGDLSAQRDITDVRDVCRAYRLLLDPAVATGTYNVASGRTVSMQEVLDMLLRLATCRVEVERDPARSRRADLPLAWGDPTKLAAATGWCPAIPLERTLSDTLEAARGAVGERMTSA